MIEYQLTVERGLGRVTLQNRDSLALSFAVMNAYPADIIDIIVENALAGTFFLLESEVFIQYGQDMNLSLRGSLGADSTFMALENSQQDWEVRVKLRDASVGNLV